MTASLQPFKMCSSFVYVAPCETMQGPNSQNEGIHPCVARHIIGDCERVVCGRCSFGIPILEVSTRAADRLAEN